MSSEVWVNTRKVLSELQSLLQCAVCGETPRKHQCLKDCEHFFCRDCVEHAHEKKCPVCSVPLLIKNRTLSSALDAASSLCDKLSSFLISTSAVADENHPSDCPLTTAVDALPASARCDRTELTSTRNISINALQSIAGDGLATAENVENVACEIVSSTKKSARKCLVRNTKVATTKVWPKASVGVDELDHNDPQVCVNVQELSAEACNKPTTNDRSAVLSTPRSCLGEHSDYSSNNSSNKHRINRLRNRLNTRSSSLSMELKPLDKTPEVQSGKKRSHRASSDKASDCTARDHEGDPSVEKDLILQSAARSESRHRKRLKATPEPASLRPMADNLSSDNSSSYFLPGSDKRPTRLHTLTSNDTLALPSDMGETPSSSSIKRISPNAERAVGVPDKERKMARVHKAIQLSAKRSGSRSAPACSDKSPEDPLLKSGSRLSWVRPVTPSGVLSTTGRRANCSATPKLGSSPAACFAVPQTSRSGSSASPGYVKRNAKGETALHTAVIKGDKMRVERLLKEGANPNVKDYANWTPLHEACNHGYVEIAELLLNHGALIDTTGHENSTPLQDAVENYRLDCVRLLVSRGASKTMRDLHGKTAVDMAVTQDMKDALNTCLAPQPSTASEEALNARGETEQENAEIVVLMTGLTASEREEVQNCVSQLGWTLVNHFSHRVTHVVASVNAEGSCPRTVKYLQAILTGKWIVNIDWIVTCLDFNRRVAEDTFEIPGSTLSPQSLGPFKGRQNVSLQLPGLFSGCQFYFVGEFHAPAPPREELTALVRLGSGTVLTREPKLDTIDALENTVSFHASADSRLANCGYFVVLDDSPGVDVLIVSPRICRVSSTWILACTAQFKILGSLQSK